MMDVIDLVRAASQGDKFKVDEPLLPKARPVLFRKTSLPVKQNIEISDLLLVVGEE